MGKSVGGSEGDRLFGRGGLVFRIGGGVGSGRSRYESVFFCSRVSLVFL